MLEKKAAATPKTGIAAKGECRHETHNQPPHVHSASVSTPTCAPLARDRRAEKHAHVAQTFPQLLLTFTQLKLNQMRISKALAPTVIMRVVDLWLETGEPKSTRMLHKHVPTW